MPAPKYIFENGIMKLNPAYLAEQNIQSTVAQPNQALAIVSSPQDIGVAMEANTNMKLVDTATKPMEMMQSEAYIKQFNAGEKVDGGKLVDGLTEKFMDMEIPIGMMGKLMALSAYRLNFIIDDSGSMKDSSDVKIKTASDHTKKNIKARFDAKGEVYDESLKMNRWEEAEDRLHVMLSMLQFIPATIRITFLNRPDVIELNHDGKRPIEFARDAHHTIRMAFVNKPSGGTPIYGKLYNEFATAAGNTMHYLFTDGEPSDKSIQDVAQLVINRRNPQLNPLTFITCSDDDQDTEWVKEVDEKAQFTAELDDFESERKEVLHDQGPAFPYSRGLWYICQLVAAINPVDLDALDESYPLTKRTMDEVLGRRLSPQEYQFYFQNHPQERKYRNRFQEFAREDLYAWQILQTPAPVYAPNAGPTMFAQPPQQAMMGAQPGYGSQPPYAQAPQYKQ